MESSLPWKTTSSISSLSTISKERSSRADWINSCRNSSCVIPILVTLFRPTSFPLALFGRTGGRGPRTVSIHQILLSYPHQVTREPVQYQAARSECQHKAKYQWHCQHHLSLNRIRRWGGGHFLHGYHGNCHENG